MKTILITGSSGLVGSEAVKFFCDLGWKVYGIDNDTRGYLFGADASTAEMGQELRDTYPNFFPISADIRNTEAIELIFKNYGKFDLIIHTAAQPAHEWSTDNALEDFQINAWGTMVMLECYRQYSPEAVFIQVSSSKVHGDHVNKLPLEELETRFDLPKNHPNYEGVDEDLLVDGNLHSLFGASKACGDVMAQEYGKYFNLKIGVFRPVCISASQHQGAEKHGYLAYLIKCIAEGKEYTINGYKGKQVRDNIHSADLVAAFWEFYQNPKCGEAYNIGGGRESNNSMSEAIAQAEQILGKKAKIKYSEINRRGDHIWCIYSSKKFKRDYPNWKVAYTNDKLMEEICSRYV